MNLKELKNKIEEIEITYDYDEWYMQDIDNTIEILENVLKEEEEYNKNGIWSDIYYQSSW